ncbi:Acetamidase/formamidase [Tistlia consotensis]|uniref:Acetamidase/formamidase n=1 Tax=Tistlia consotensis USBA 355 TaxID=560819 RepID=A0A1Y6C0N2_9PROT|nr:acetamidase/formamidase family protein [Tistlia consotensis]SMF37370.1 Acetamidase/formamidase [Tistlia consotensis USBA 355]SNR72718.1 Acetamidase/formamidase [Tistlia consotensis]
MPTHHHLPSRPETVHWGFWDARLEPVLQVESGDTFTIDTLSGEPEDMPGSGSTVVEGHREVHARNQRGPGPHFMTGPIHVAGAEPGDVLQVRLLDIALRQDWGWNLQLPLHGTLPEDFPEKRLIHIPLDREAMEARLPWGGKLPLRPFFGNFGVAPPAHYGRCNSIVPREFGGNLDNKELVAGTTVYFPVFNEGALFSAGDGHAVQGDGEVCLTAIETCLTGTVELSVRKDMTLAMPRAETAESWITMGLNEDLDDAARQALREMIDLIVELAGLRRQDAYSLCSLAADLRITQMVDVNKGVHCMLPKSALPA